MSGHTGKKQKIETPVFQIGQVKSPIILGTDLLNQQLWCWGRDVEHTSGNLLLEYGFQRTEKPAKSHATSLYELKVSDTACVVLRGFGIFYGDDRWGGLFLQRYRFRPVYTKHSKLKKPSWKVEDLPKLSLPRPDTFETCRSLLADMVDWIYAYERWILIEQGVSYRRQTVDLWQKDKKKAICAEKMATTWATLKMFFCDGSEESLSQQWNSLGMLSK